MIIDLEQKLGLGLKFDDESHQLIFEDPEIVMGRFDIKTTSELNKISKNNSAKFLFTNAYRTYRNIRRKPDEEEINLAKLRYDITIIPPGFLAYKNEKELIRTAGHYHEIKAGTGLGFPEIYEVIQGQVLWLIQKPEEADYSKLSKIYLIESNAGEKAIMLPSYGHISINPSHEPLILANWISDGLNHNYEPFKKYRGGGYWLMQDTAGKISLEKNTNYSKIPEIKKLHAKEMPEFGLFKTEPLYRIVHDLTKIRFLTYPEEFKKKLTIENCFNNS